MSGGEEYIVERSDANNPGVFSVRDTVTTTQFDDTGLTEGLTYSYRVSTVAGGLASVNLVAYLLGGGLTVLALLVTVTDFCLPSRLYRALFKQEINSCAV